MLKISIDVPRKPALPSRNRQRAFAVILVLLVLTSCTPTATSPTQTPQPVSTNTPEPTNTAQPSPTPTLAPGDTRVRDTDNMTMVYVPGGEFPLGMTVDAQNQNCLNYYVICNPSDYNETVRTVILDPYWIDQTEVTFGQYLACVNAGACQFGDSQITRAIQTGYVDLGLVTDGSTLEDIIDPEYFDHPVVLVSWEDANTYCQWAGARLPTVSEWEAAARGVDGRLYPWGNEPPSSDLLNYNHTATTTVVGSYPNGASPYGALDMAGNVAEWVSDWYSDDFMVLTDPHNPQGAADGTRRMIMGSSWFNGDVEVLLASYYMNSPTNFDILYGFRCAQSER